MSSAIATGPCRVLLVEALPLLRLGLREMISDTADFLVCGESSDAPQGLQLLLTTAPDLVVLDSPPHGVSLLEAIHLFQQAAPSLPLVVFTQYDERVYALRSLRAGARAYLPKHSPWETLLEGLRQVRCGAVVLSESMTALLVQASLDRHPVQPAHPLALLSDRELEVLQYLGYGYSIQDIAKKLHLSVKTVETHRTNVMTKLQLTHVRALLVFAIHWLCGQSP
ncbi:MAG: LuxR C-terminal-related transcriptional regulator [Candidatus Tectimicrobiota bacterium]